MKSSQTLTRLILRIMWLAFLAGSLNACTLSGPSIQPSPAVDRPLRWSLEGIDDLTALDPARPADHQSNAVINLVFAGLVRLDDRLQVQADGAERWEVSDDGRVYIFTLREQLAFGDDTPVTAEDFVYSINRALTPELAVYGARDFLKNIEGATAMAEGQATSVRGVRALDARRLEIRLAEPIAYFLSLLTYTHTFAVPRARIERDGDSWADSAVGSGPYRVRQWQHGSQIVLEANPHYWRGTPGVATIEISFYPDSDAAVDAYLAGGLDIVGNIQSGLPAARSNELENRADLRRSNALTVRYVGFNNRLPPSITSRCARPLRWPSINVPSPSRRSAARGRRATVFCRWACRGPVYLLMDGCSIRWRRARPLASPAIFPAIRYRTSGGPLPPRPIPRRSLPICATIGAPPWGGISN
ncbi:hypothetical protein HC891_19120 [Candidatus Gracilibacteria bacterium]|nr:hypothetical protein [Candidatus Gracilibacteria bacterium]